MKNSTNKGVAVSALLSVLLFLCDCENQGVVLDVDSVERIELNEHNSDIKIVPIKCDFPMDDIYRCLAFDDYTFLLSMSWKTIYCIQGDTVISVLDASGRGHGEYSYINDFTYSKEEQILYVQGDGKYYLYSVPSMSFIRSFESDITPGGMVVLNPNEFLMKCSFYDGKEDVYRGICIVSSQTGEVLRKCSDFDYINTQWFMQRDLSLCEEGILYPINSVYNNTLVCYNEDNGRTENVFSFTYNSKWRIPKRLAKLAQKDPLFFSREYNERNLFCEGCHYPAYINSRLTFWSFPREKDDVKSIVTIVKDGEPVSRSFIVSGTDMTPSPYCISGNYCVDIISLDDIAITDPDNISPFALELNKIVKAQQFENPVLLYFTVDKGL